MIDRIHAFRTALQDAAAEQRIPATHGVGLFAPSVREARVCARARAVATSVTGSGCGIPRSADAEIDSASPACRSAVKVPGAPRYT